MHFNKCNAWVQFSDNALELTHRFEESPILAAIVCVEKERSLHSMQFESLLHPRKWDTKLFLYIEEKYDHMTNRAALRAAERTASLRLQ